MQINKWKYLCTCAPCTAQDYINFGWPPDWNSYPNTPWQSWRVFLSLSFLGRSDGWVQGMTPPWGMIMPLVRILISSSLRMASWMCLGVIRLFFSYLQQVRCKFNKNKIKLINRCDNMCRRCRMINDLKIFTK